MAGKKPSVAMVLAIGNKKKPGSRLPQVEGGPDEEKNEQEGGGDEYESLAGQMLDAIGSGDAAEFSRALHAYIDLCISGQSDDSAEDSSGGY